MSGLVVLALGGCGSRRRPSSDELIRGLIRILCAELECGDDTPTEAGDEAIVRRLSGSCATVDCAAADAEGPLQSALPLEGPRRLVVTVRNPTSHRVVLHSARLVIEQFDSEPYDRLSGRSRS
jgi:hypothetical protein